MDLNELPGELCSCLVELVNIIHLGAILKPTNKIDRLGPRLLPLEGNETEVISRPRQGLAIDLFLLRGEYCGELERFQIDHVEGVAGVQSANTSIDDELLSVLLKDTLMVS